MADGAVYEPVAETAALAKRKAAELCNTLYSGQQDCTWYHGVWQYLRLLGLAATPEKNAAFFLNTLEALASDGRFPRVLVSGTADYSMLAYVMHAYRNADRKLAATVLDQCETPLYLCRWYARQMSQTIETCAANFLEFEPAEQFDVVCCHSFLQQFSKSQRNDLVKVWRRTLRPGGKLVTNTRIIPGCPLEGTKFSKPQAAAFRDRVFSEAAKLPTVLNVDPDEIADAAKQYANRIVIYHFQTEQEITDLFETGGFDLERLETIETKGEFANGKTGPTINRSGTYTEIIAVRR